MSLLVTSRLVLPDLPPLADYVGQDLALPLRRASCGVYAWRVPMQVVSTSVYPTSEAFPAPGTTAIGHSKCQCISLHLRRPICYVSYVNGESLLTHRQIRILISFIVVTLFL